MSILIIQKALMKDGSDFKNWTYGADKKILINSCPKCDSDILCVYADMGVSDFCDTYHHICMNSKCEFIVKKDEFNISMGTREEHGPAPCPFCGRIIF